MAEDASTGQPIGEQEAVAGGTWSGLNLEVELARTRRQLAHRDAELDLINSVQQGLARQLDLQSITRLVGDGALRAGDFFGEIAALTNVPRTANVVLEEDANLLQVPATTLREMAGYPALNRAFVSKMTERMIRMRMIDMPRVSTMDQQAMRDLRRPDPQLQAATASD